jgi:hypothetical protein
MQVVNANLEAAFGQPVPHFRRDKIVTFRDDIEGRTKPEADLDLRQLLDSVEAALALDVVGQDKRELFPVPPSWPPLRRTRSGLIDRPAIAGLRANLSSENLLDPKPDTSGDERLATVI